MRIISVDEPLLQVKMKAFLSFHSSLSLLFVLMTPNPPYNAITFFVLSFSFVFGFFFSVLVCCGVSVLFPKKKKKKKITTKWLRKILHLLKTMQDFWWRTLMEVAEHSSCLLPTRLPQFKCHQPY